jgi:putative membrane protein
VFRLDAPGVVITDPSRPLGEETMPEVRAVVRESRDEDVFGAPPDPEALEAERAAKGLGLLGRRFWSWGQIFVSATAGLVLLWLMLAVERFVVDLVYRDPVLGWIALGLAAIAGIALLALFIREVAAILRARSIGKIKLAAEGVMETDDRSEARAVAKHLLSLYGHRPETARARTRIDETQADIIDGRDLILFTERELMAPLDIEARTAVAFAARRVSVVTAVSPKALVDVLFVAAQAIRLLRRVSEIYGGRPGFFGFLRLTRAVAGHLAVTGGMAVGDSLVQQVLGHGIAARLSAKLGEGVLNGLLTARVGLSAIAVCRPLPFSALPAPTIKDVAGFLLDREKPARSAEQAGR